ncbi:DoxX family protein [Microvirga thermotolerans]|uniref:DoxX family membrane protein n=1 Tax=Microvirga thermotolerans TaxID=2651334 RepID=A0A5P9JWA2_9HYPH|nr:DoxX family protein [Microvirga thermotolerans]QFU17092.1 DoxX family membrane protein [Microvirga thermotolerans]
MRDMLLLIGRVLLAAIFIISGVTKFYALGATAGYIASKGLPAAWLLAPVAAVVEVALGLAVAIGLKTRWASLALALFTLVTIPFFHDFWNMTGADRNVNQIQAMKNLSMIGAFLILMASGPGRLSVDRA